VVDRVQANVAPLKSKDRFGRVSRMGAICALPPSAWPLRMIAIHHWRCSAGGSINDQSPAQGGSLPFPRDAGRQVSCPIPPVRAASTKSSAVSGASSHREQPPLPTPAGFEFVAEHVASHDGSLSTLR